jgi:hypothetical protein
LPSIILVWTDGNGDLHNYYCRNNVVKLMQWSQQWL